MIADQVSHDVLAALIGGVALVIVATVPMLWANISRKAGALDALERRVTALELKLEGEHAATMHRPGMQAGGGAG